jgi:hypothetical protein
MSCCPEARAEHGDVALARERKVKKQKIDTRPEVSEAWRAYLANPDSVGGWREDCPCPKMKCERHGQCRLCYDFHASGKRLPFCER